MLNKRGFTLVELLVVIALSGVVRPRAGPPSREPLPVKARKKGSGGLFGLDRHLGAEAAGVQVDYIFVLNIPAASYYVITSDMTPEKLLDVEKTAKRLPGATVVLDVVKQKNEKISDGKVEIKFGRNNISPPVVLHLAEEEDRMTLVVNPFLGVTAVYDHYADISVDDGLGRDTSK